MNAAGGTTPVQVLASFNLLRRQAEEPLYNADLVDGVGDEEVRAFSATVDMFENYMRRRTDGFAKPSPKRLFSMRRSVDS